MAAAAFVILPGYLNIPSIYNYLTIVFVFSLPRRNDSAPCAAGAEGGPCVLRRPWQTECSTSGSASRNQRASPRWPPRLRQRRARRLPRTRLLAHSALPGLEVKDLRVDSAAFVP